MKVMCVFGTRPEVIKIAPVIHAFKENNIDVISVSTGQHREMLDQTMSVFNLKSDVSLEIMTHNQTIHDVLSYSVKKLGDLFIQEKPCIVIGQGDTTTTLAAALSSYFNKIDFAHIEAGLRTYDLENPWPEETNRIVISRLSKIHFCPTQRSADNLMKESIIKNVYVTGNTVIDSLLSVVGEVKNTNTETKKILCTMHRRENFGKPLNEILEALIYLANENKNIEITIPVHPNPNIKNTVEKKLSHPRIHLCRPMDYKSFCVAMSESYFIITDSGGIQEEAPALGKPVLVLRKYTERPEAVELGLVKLVGHDKEKIIKEASSLLNSKEEYEKMSKGASPYGDGKSSERITKIIKNWIKINTKNT